MKIVGCDLHTRYQQVAMLEQEVRETLPASPSCAASHSFAKNANEWGTRRL